MISLLVTATCGCGAAQEAAPAEAAGASSAYEAAETAESGDGDMGNSDCAEPVETVTPEYAQGEELLCLCDNEEEAKKIADLYSIELVQFRFGVATFHAEDPQAVIALGKEKGYPELELNGISHICDN